MGKWVVKLFSEIETCQRCELYHNQKPLLDKVRNADIMFVGISAKSVHDKNEIPLDVQTRSGKIISLLEGRALEKGYSVYRTNLVKCVPLNPAGKIRYPNKEEIAACINNFIIEYESIKPQLVVVLGSQVQVAIEKYFNVKFQKAKDCEFVIQKVDKYTFVLCYHPSYIVRYKSKLESYLNNFIKMLNQYQEEMR